MERSEIELARQLPQRLRAHGLTATSEQITDTMMALKGYYEHRARTDEQYADYWRECAHAFTSYRKAKSLDTEKKKAPAPSVQARQPAKKRQAKSNSARA